MNQNTLLLFDGPFGRRTAAFAAAMLPLSSLAELPRSQPASAATVPTDCRTALVLLSTANHASMEQLARVFLDAGVAWTAVHAYPTIVRIGPLVRPGSVCHGCATRRYRAMPGGGSGQSRLEDLLQSAGSADVSFPGALAASAALAAAEAVRQLGDPETPAGFIRKFDLVEHIVASAVALPLHGCACANGGQARRQPAGERFCADLERDLLPVHAEAMA